MRAEDSPGGRHEPGQRLPRVAAEVHGVQDRVGLRQRAAEYRVDQLRPRGEVPIEGDPADTGGPGDVGNAGRRVAS
jgi:hypothetical protein